MQYLNHLLSTANSCLSISELRYCYNFNMYCYFMNVIEMVRDTKRLILYAACFHLIYYIKVVPAALLFL